MVNWSLLLQGALGAMATACSKTHTFGPLSKRKKIAWLAFIIWVLGMVVPQPFSMPVDGATSADYHKDSFWFYPWGRSVTHKGIDIFARSGATVRSSTPGLVLFRGKISMGGNVVIVIGPKWRLHYYAHLDEVRTSMCAIVSRSSPIGTVGATGNAAGKPPHLHYSILTPIPYPWRIDGDKQGWKKMFFLNPADYLD